MRADHAAAMSCSVRRRRSAECPKSPLPPRQFAGCARCRAAAGQADGRRAV